VSLPDRSERIRRLFDELVGLVTIREASEPGATPPATLREALADRYTLEREIGRGGHGHRLPGP